MRNLKGLGQLLSYRAIVSEANNRNERGAAMTTRHKILIVIGALVGAFFGSSMGIAGFGGAIAGTIPLAVLGGYVGYRLGKPKTDG